ncbi:cellulose-binding domain-containing protein [Streptomyces sp. KMM 9044]|uniref:cellulose-binding domain-containing protein n=1 Tax=Streptomyces sp. KMM 9044 TaxID=2744474 RepID=UPI0021514DA9|nr:cellulose-binding domain-containing protein [Streptomyces sp. KMM 9044]WAX77236.1 cellulose-binding domain-containing protein [Streptomyces sp. KMM 9044]
MTDLPAPQDATEAALFSECWDAVLSYADLCTAGSTAAAQLAREAFAQGIREVREAEASTVRGTGRRSSRLPRIPLLLAAVRTTAADWEGTGQGHRLDPDLRLWLHSDKAARYTGPPLSRPIALRGLRDLQQADAELLWLAEAESLPLPLVARRLGLDPVTAADELTQVRGLFRDRCHRNHLDSPMDAECRSYARLLDAVTRSPAADTPDDLSRHLAVCVQCAEAAACLRMHGGGLPVALTGGVIGWGGLAYLERRRRAAEARLGPGRPDGPGVGGVPADVSQRARVVRNRLMVAAVLVSGAALAVSLMQFGGAEEDRATLPDADRQAVANPDPYPPEGPGAVPPASASGSAPASASGAAPADAPKPPTDGRAPGRPTPDTGPDPEPQGSTSATASPPRTTAPSKPAVCHATYDLGNQWPDGFQATLTVTTTEPLESWRVAFTFRDGQRVTQMWDAEASQKGSRVTATAADYNKTAPAGGKLAFGFLASWTGKNSPPTDVTLNGHSCASG